MVSGTYQEFSFFDDNREIIQGKVKKLAESIEEIGYIQANPIIVDKKLRIIDGQHRFLACQELGLPIHYEISEVDHERAMILLNTTQNSWRMSDYVRLWTKRGVECYMVLSQFESKYRLGISNSMKVVFDNYASGGAVKEGKQFVISKNKDDIAEFIYECKETLDFWKSAKFIHAIVLLFNMADKKDIAKLREKAMVFRRQPTTQDYLQLFENVINKGKSKKIRLTYR